MTKCHGDIEALVAFHRYRLQRIIAVLAADENLGSKAKPIAASALTPV